MGSTRIKGDALRLTIDGVDYWADASSVVLSRSDELPTTLNADYDWTMAITAVQSTQDGSLWRLLWQMAGGWTTYVYAPHGNTEPTGDQPHFTGSALLPDVSTLGGEAGETTEYTFSVTIPLRERPQMLTEPNES